MITAFTAVLGISLSSTAGAGTPPVFTKSVAPPKVLEGIRPGMTIEEAKAALLSFSVDEMYKDAAQRKRLIKSAGNGAKYYVLLANNVVSRIGIEAPDAGLVPKLTKLWGAPNKAVNAANEGITSWSDASNRWRIDLACRPTLCRLAYHKVLTAEFFGNAVAPPGPLSAIKLGMTREQVAQLAAPYAAGTEVPAGPEDVRLSVDAKDGRVRSIMIAGLPPDAGELLSAAWGRGTAVDDKPVWFNPKTGWRARYDAQLQLVQLTEYMPVVSLLGPGDKLALPLIGLTEKQLASVYPKFQVVAGGGQVMLPPTEFATALTMIGVQIDPRTGRTARARFALPFVTDAHKAELLAVLEAKWGKAKAEIKNGRTRLVYPKATTRVEVLADDAATQLLVELR